MMIRDRRKFRTGLTLIELVAASAIDLIVMSAAAALLVSGHRGWSRAYGYANSNIQRNAVETMLAFGKIGRMSNKTDYVLYKVNSGTFTGPVLPPASDPQAVVFGDAVEFRHWDTDLAHMSESQQKATMKADVTGNAYVLFYLEGGYLKVDRGRYPPGGVDGAGTKRTPSSTQVLAENVQYLRFSHTTRNAQGDGQGCVKLEMRLHDTTRGTSITVETATLMRNVWP
jgi:hypothetical protein